ncbi:MAG: CZB domain-containing protein [Methylocystis sp.]|uniref:CZB domain-containing protein n=1 Tax=Methylocystis sp. TaxID=1911079 RepID=UPI003DA65A50
MDFERAIAAHVEWKTKLRGAIVSQSALDATAAAKDNVCPFGQWLHGEARSKYAHLADFSTCMQAHATFHREAGRVAALINARQYGEATAALDANSPYAKASMDTTVAITKLRREIGA